jgi:small-conductance mechanosensitive channel
MARGEYREAVMIEPAIPLVDGSFVQLLVAQIASRVGLALLIALAAWLGSRWTRASCDHIARRTKADEASRLLVGRLAQGITLALGLLAVLSILGVNESLILTTFGTVGLALGLALQDVLRSFFAGLYLLFERPFRLGDELQIKDYRGRIERVGFRTTSLRTADNTIVLVPNTVVFSEVVLNRSEAREEPDEDAGLH